MHGDSMLNYSIQYQAIINDFKITFQYIKRQPYCKMLKVAEAVKSCLNVVQKLELYVNMQYVKVTHIYIYFCFEGNK